MSYSLYKVRGWSYYAIDGESSNLFTYGFFTKKGPDLKRDEDKKTFLEAFSLNRVVMMRQEHGDSIHVVRNGENPVYGDALIILEKNTAAIVRSADCLPIILMDPASPLAAIIHAGYKGTLKRITEKTLALIESLGSKPSQIQAIIGPSICKCCYNVGEDLAFIFEKEFGREGIVTFKNGKTYIDLREANISMLANSGVRKIHSVDICTSCHNDIFFSYRKGDKSKRQISFVAVRDLG